MTRDRAAPDRGDGTDDAVMEQAWLEEQVALYQSLCEEGADHPSPVEFAARATFPPGRRSSEVDLRTQLAQRLRILKGLRQVLRGSSGGDFAPGVIFQDIEIIERIGKGGMGQVFLARQLSVDRFVALKTPLWAASLDARNKARFWREAQAVARLRHPGVVPVFEVGERDGCPFLVFEFVEGCTLAATIRDLRKGRLARVGASLARPEVSYEEACVQIAVELLSALEAAHDAGIVHRDIKPSNVMMDRSGRVRVLDFGLARLPQAHQRLTGSNERLGTLEYTAPEVLENPRTAAPASDVYAVGVLLYELIALEPPFGGESPEAVLTRIHRGPPTPLHERTGSSRALSSIVARAMARDPERRHPTATALRGELEALLKGDGGAERTAGDPLARLARGVRRYVTPGVLVAGVAAVTITLVWLVFDSDRIEAKGGSRANAQARLLDDVRSAMIWEYAEPWEDGAGRREAIRRLSAAVSGDPAVLLPRERLHLAVLLAETGDRRRAREELAALESAGWDYQAMRWLRDLLNAEPSGRGSASVLGPGDASPVPGTHVDRFYAARAFAAAGEREPCLRIARGLADHPLYGPAIALLEALCWQRDPGRNPERARERLRAAAEQLPAHPVILSHLAALEADSNGSDDG